MMAMEQTVFGFVVTQQIPFCFSTQRQGSLAWGQRTLTTKHSVLRLEPTQPSLKNKRLQSKRKLCPTSQQEAREEYLESKKQKCTGEVLHIGAIDINEGGVAHCHQRIAPLPHQLVKRKKSMGANLQNVEDPSNSLNDGKRPCIEEVGGPKYSASPSNGIIITERCEKRFNGSPQPAFTPGGIQIPKYR